MELSKEFIDSFIYDYDKLTINEIKKKYDISGNKYSKIKKELGLGKKKQVYKLNDFERKYNIGYEPKNYTKAGKRFVVNKTKNCKRIQYISCRSEEVAKDIVKLFNKYGWDESNIPKIMEEVDYERREFEYKYRDFDFDSFKKDYNNMNLDELLEKYGLTFHTYSKIKNYLGLKTKKHIRKCWKKRRFDE